MKPVSQIIAIGKAHGWKECWITQNGTPWGFLGAKHYSQPIPNYLNDLNAMHEVEKAVFRSSNLWQKFVFELIETSGGSGMCELDGLCCLARATATQRAEAFLRTIGKWEECK